MDKGDARQHHGCMNGVKRRKHGFWRREVLGVPDALLGALLGALLAGAACVEDAGSGGGLPSVEPRDCLAPVDQWPERTALPDLMESCDGTRRVQTAEDFTTWRRDELLRQFSHHVYGRSPPATPVGVTVDATLPGLAGGLVTGTELTVTLGDSTAALHVLVLAPNGVTRPPAFLGPNKCGNQSLLSDVRLRATTSTLMPACGASVEATRGDAAAQWPVEALAAAGMALVTFHESDAAPDDVNHQDKALAARLNLPDGDRAQWGVVAQWAWANQRVMDALETLDLLDTSRVAVFGHSRRGKAALWTGAQDPRFSLVVAHQSGTAGAAISRNGLGESVEAITLFFPHWFSPLLATFAGQEARLPVDQHQLLALVAPRPLLVTDGSEDDHADPAGARAAVEAAHDAWTLQGATGVVHDGSGIPTTQGTLAWHVRPGGHSVGAEDWAVFVPFAAARW